MTSCKEYTTIQKMLLKNEINTYDKKPVLAVIQIDHDLASDSYIKGKKSDCEEGGIKCIHLEIDSNKTTQEELEKIIKNLNYSNSCNGIIIQLPIPEKYNIKALQQYISPEKDVDGFRIDSFYKPCTPKGIMNWLHYNNYDLQGKNVVVIGRSNIVGKPLVNMLIDEGATVTCCNSKTRKIEDFTRNSDLIITAIGKPKYFDYRYFYEPDIIIDVGINRTDSGHLCGDINRDNVLHYHSSTYVTPVPGGVGLLTRLALLENVFEAYKNQKIRECNLMNR